jgi:hypothetical protein
VVAVLLLLSSHCAIPLSERGCLKERVATLDLDEGKEVVNHLLYLPTESLAEALRRMSLFRY